MRQPAARNHPIAVLEGAHQFQLAKNCRSTNSVLHILQFYVVRMWSSPSADIVNALTLSPFNLQLCRLIPNYRYSYLLNALSPILL